VIEVGRKLTIGVQLKRNVKKWGRNLFLLYEVFEDIKGVIRIRKSKDRQHNLLSQVIWGISMESTLQSLGKFHFLNFLVPSIWLGAFFCYHYNNNLWSIYL
jgi:hypothetical protein